MRAPNNVPAERMEVIRDYFQSGRVKAFDGWAVSKKRTHYKSGRHVNQNVEIFNVVLV
jgi:hypothetical protein